MHVRSVEGEERVTPLELFFDLVFVFDITQFTGFLTVNETGEGLLRAPALRSLGRGRQFRRRATREVAGWRGRIRTFDLLIQSQTTRIGFVSRSSTQPGASRRPNPGVSGEHSRRVRRTLPEESGEHSQKSQANTPRRVRRAPEFVCESSELTVLRRCTAAQTS